MLEDSVIDEFEFSVNDLNSNRWWSRIATVDDLESPPLMISNHHRWCFTVDDLESSRATATATRISRRISFDPPPLWRKRRPRLSKHVPSSPKSENTTTDHQKEHSTTHIPSDSRSWCHTLCPSDSMWYVVIRCDVTWCAKIRCDVIWCVTIMWYYMTWCDVMWYDMIRFEKCDMVRYPLPIHSGSPDVMWYNVMW